MPSNLACSSAGSFKLKLTRDAILHTAQQLIDAKGLKALSMRAVAGRLDAQGSALYWHFRNKSDLITTLAQSYYERAVQAVPQRVRWTDWLLSFGRALHKELLSHRDSCEIYVAARPTDRHAAEVIERMVLPLTGAGLSRSQALLCQSAVIAFTVGWVTYEQSPSQRAQLSKIMNLQHNFDEGLKALVNGLAQQA